MSTTTSERAICPKCAGPARRVKHYGDATKRKAEREVVECRVDCQKKEKQ